jgi:hypothetical protein
MLHEAQQSGGLTAAFDTVNSNKKGHKSAGWFWKMSFSAKRASSVIL